MSNIGRRKCKYFGAASFSFLVFLFIFFFFKQLRNFLIFLLHLSLSCQQAYRCLPSVPSALVSASGTFSSQTRRPTGNRKTDRQRGREGRRRGKKKIKLHWLVCFVIQHAEVLIHVTVVWQEASITSQPWAHLNRQSLSLFHTHTHYF